MPDERLVKRGDIIVFNGTHHKIDTLIYQKVSDEEYNVEFIDELGEHILWRSALQGGYVLRGNSLLSLYMSALKNTLVVCEKYRIQSLIVECKELMVHFKYSGVKGKGVFSVYSNSFIPEREIKGISLELLQAFKEDIFTLVDLNSNIGLIMISVSVSNPHTFSTKKKRTANGYEDAICLHLARYK